MLSLSVELKEFNVIYHVKTPPGQTGNDLRVSKTTLQARLPIIRFK